MSKTVYEIYNDTHAEMSEFLRGAAVEILSQDEARQRLLQGWNLRCNRCGTFGAVWVPGERPGWGALALCPPHKKELVDERERHRRALAELRKINFEQPRGSR